MGSRRLGALAIGVAIAALVLAGRGSGADTPTAAFSGTASADGVRVTIDIPGGPLLDKIIDVGGPTAQVSVSTLGTSTAYAALPDPGQLVNSGPGLIVGLLAQGAYGLPPIKLPSLPVKQVDPLQVATDANGTTHGSLGAGPYKISAQSAATSGVADATGGLDNLGGTSVAGLHSHSAVTLGSDGSVQAAATATITGLKLGPLTIGSIVSSATETLGANGKITSKASTGLSLLAINGVPLPLPLLDLSSASAGSSLLKVLAPLLKPLGITLQFGTISTSAGSVTAPTVTVSMPFDTGKSGLKGTASVTFGATTATMAGSIIAPVVPPVVPSGPGYTPPPVAGSVPVTAPGVVGTPPVTSSSAAQPPIAGPPRLVARSTGLIGIFNVKALYLVLAGFGLVVLLLSQLIRILGVRA